jgi:2-oxoglutarate dehydrogenase E1 component
MRSVRIAAAAGIVATGLALGAAGVASAATPNTAPAPAPAQAKTAPAQAKAVPAKPAPAPAQATAVPAKAVPAKTTPARVHAKPTRIVHLSASKVRAIAAAQAKHAKTAQTTRANYVVTASHLNVRTGPGTKYRVAGTLAKGAHVVAGTTTVDGFRQLSNGHWISAHYLKAAR